MEFSINGDYRMFVGREAELQQLTEVFAQPGKQAVMLC